MGRRDYYDDPSAPAANSLVPAASVVATDDEGRILLHRRRDNDLWALPGGVMELGESLADCARRETKEETGFDIKITGLIGVYSDPKHVFAYDDGEVRQEFSICLSGKILGGSILASDESTAVEFFHANQLDAIPINDAIRLRITDFLNRDTPAIR